MKPNIHPDYHVVAFHDTAADSYFIIGSTIKTNRTIEIEGKTYPYVPTFFPQNHSNYGNIAVHNLRVTAP